jgi:hypothetical protein
MNYLDFLHDDIIKEINKHLTMNDIISLYNAINYDSSCAEKELINELSYIILKVLCCKSIDAFHKICTSCNKSICDICGKDNLSLCKRCYLSSKCAMCGAHNDNHHCIDTNRILCISCYTW